MGIEEAVGEITDALARDYGGVMGIAATFLPTGEGVFVNADEVFPTASVIKVAIVSELLTQVADGRVSLDEMVPITENVKVAGSGILALLSPVSLPLRDLALLTLSISDNTASNLCLAAVGGPAVVNARMQGEWGMERTIIYRPIKFALEAHDPPHTATGSPRDMLRLFVRLGQGKLHDAPTSQAVIALLREAHDADMLPRNLAVNPYAAALRVEHPPFVVAHKPGKVSGVRNDAALIQRGDQTLAVCVYSKNVRDDRWTPANVGEEAVARVGKTLVDHFWGDEA